MKNVITQLAETLPEATKQIESELAGPYAITEFQLSVHSAWATMRYQVQCVDDVYGFQCASGATLEEALNDLKKRLTVRADVKAQKIAYAERLLREANES